MGMEDDVGDIAHAKLKAIVPFQSLPVNPLAVDEGAVLAALIDHAELPVFRHDEGMIARHTGICDNQIFINLSSDTEWAMVEIDGTLVISLNEDQDGEYSRPRIR